MDSPDYQLRRATVDDLVQLRELWTISRLPALELERRFTEFQIAVTPEGEIAAGLGLHIERQQGEVHSEIMRSPEMAETMRPLLWDRLLTVAKNHGLLRLWALATTSFFREKGMEDPDPAILAKLPTSFGHPQAGWLTLKLKEEVAAPLMVEQELALMSQAAREQTQAMARRTQMLRIVAYGLLAIVLIALGVAGFLAFKQLPQMRHPGP